LLGLDRLTSAITAHTGAAEARHRIDGGVDMLTSFLQSFQRNVALLSGQILSDPGNDVI
jgi:hypothetical protein